ncbi:MAG: peptidoglycan bridge formation glycyltransferase FemA/FemB family protein [Deltaproteobacteria bacterium]|nr:peptidoglycan bridge formation glycyltransferase FemA/FemB family protein [Deltaproteobacteria bacterium]
MRLLINTDVHRPAWRSFLLENIFASPFQSEAFYDFINSVDQFSSDVFTIEENNNYTSLAVVVLQKEKGLKSFLTRRAVIYGGPLLKPGNRQSLKSLLVSIKKYYGNRIIYLEVRNYFDYSQHIETYESIGFTYNPWVNFWLKTDNLEKMQSGMSNSRLRQVKKAIRSGVQWHEAKNENEIQSFFSILNRLYKQKIKKPLPPEAFFLNFFLQSVGKYLLVTYKGDIIGGIMCALIQGKAIYEYYICGLDNEYKDQYPSVMATWAAMEYAWLTGIKYLDFMGAGNPDQHYGVREFKARFGGKKVEYGRFLYKTNSTLFSLGKLGLRILKIIKV